MGISNTTIQRQAGFFHSLSTVLTKENRAIGSESYKSSHNIQTSEIWSDSIPYAFTFNDAVSNAADVNTPQLTQVGTEISRAIMYPLRDTEFQTWFIDTGTPSVIESAGCLPSENWVKPLINPFDVTRADGLGSAGYAVRLYDPTGNPVSYDNAGYDVDYYGGFIKFQPGSTPKDSGNGMGFTYLESAFQTAVSGGTASVKTSLATNGPGAIAFQYTGQYLDEYLLNLPTSSGGGGGSEEWQSSVNGQLIHIGNNQTVAGLTGINDQIDYLNENYTNYFIITDDDITGVGASWSGITATNSYYEFNGDTFTPHGLTSSDDKNRFLLLENSLVLDTLIINASGSYVDNGTASVLPDRIIELISSSVSGLGFDAWEVTDPRIGMVTTLDNLSSSLVRYVGQSTGWVEYQFESTFKVNSQRDLPAITTTHDNDIAINQTLQFEPSGDKSVDVLVNGVEMPFDYYAWGNPGSTTSLTVTGDNTTNNQFTITGTTVSVNQYLILNNGTTDYYRKVVSVTGSSPQEVTYSGLAVSNLTTGSAQVFSITERDNNVARKGDFLLWKGSSWYHLTQEAPADLVTLEYVTIDSGALNA